MQITPYSAAIYLRKLLLPIWRNSVTIKGAGNMLEFKDITSEMEIKHLETVSELKKAVEKNPYS